MPRQPSRAQRWSDAAADAEAALELLLELQQEYQDWLDNLPENLQSSVLADKLTTVADLDLEGALDTVRTLSEDDLPKGFGRD